MQQLLKRRGGVANFEDIYGISYTTNEINAFRLSSVVSDALLYESVNIVPKPTVWEKISCTTNQGNDNQM